MSYQKEKEEKPRIEKRSFGVWEIALLSSPSALHRISELQIPSRESIVRAIEIAFQDLPQVVRFFSDIYCIAPRQFIVYAISNLWSGVEGGLSLYFTSHLLELVSISSAFVENKTSWLFRSVISYKETTLVKTRLSGP